MMPLSPRSLIARTGNVHEKLVHDIARQIISGRLKPGDPIALDAFLSGDGSVSRSSLREALRVLTTMGLVEARPRTGTRVQPQKYWKLLDRDFLLFQFLENPEPGFVRNIFEVRRLIEPQAAALAAERAMAPDIEALKAAFAQMEASSDSPQRWLDADFEFHRCIFAATHNQILEQFISLVSITLLNAVRLPSHRLQPHGTTMAEHRAILDAICDGDAQAAELAVRQLINRVLAPADTPIEA